MFVCLLIGIINCFIVNGNDLWKSERYNSYNEFHMNLSSAYFPNNPCKRQCTSGVSLTCYFHFTIHYYEAAGTACSNKINHKRCIYSDGTPTGIIVANRKMPGPILEVCENDTIITDVQNNLQEGTTIHWHGIHMKKTPDMDGSPYTTQYPIDPGNTFRYRFVATQYGTFWWHSHMHFQRGYGLAGPLIIRRPNHLERHSHLYDYDLTDHIVFLQDWFYNFTSTTPTNILINGKGHMNDEQIRKNLLRSIFRYETFRVEELKRYRFRVIYNGNANCPLKLSIDKHTLMIINSDSNDIEPTEVKSIIVLAGERYDFVLNASQIPGNYWLRVKGLGFCQTRQMYQVAIVHYKNAPKGTLPKKKLLYGYKVKGAQLNAIDAEPYNANKIPITELNSLDPTPWNENTVFKTFYTSMGIYHNSSFFGFQMDDIYFEKRPTSLLQVRHLDMEQFFCNKSSLKQAGKNCKEELCKCSNIIQIPAYEYIEFVLSSETATGHPFHPHGIDFRVVGMGTLNATDIRKIEEIDKKTPLKRRLDMYPIIKDSVQVPGFGYTIIRFFSDNPGYWMFHCHLLLHSEDGMMAILKIGEPYQMVYTPRGECS